MTFLEPALLALLPLAALPVVIHLIHQMRRKPVPWAAMMFLLRAQRMDRGLSRLRQILILACRVLAVAGILFVVTRPLAGGWLGLTGGAPDTVLILLDRSASMEQHPPTAPASKRQAGLRNLAKALRDTVGTRSRLFLLESATPEPVTLERPESLTDIPATSATDTRADIPALLQSALDFITTNRSGRTDVWLLSDLQRSDWARQDGRWDALRKAFAGLNAVRFHLLSYPETPTADAGIRITRIHRTATASKAELLLDLELSQSSSETSSNNTVDLRVVVKGLAQSAYQRFGKADTPMGNMAWLRIGEHDDEAIEIVVNDYRTQAFSPPCFTAVGIDITKCRGLIVKSTQHFHAGFQPVADDILYVSAPGSGSMDMKALPFTRVTRPVWPRVADPHAAE